MGHSEKQLMLMDFGCGTGFNLKYLAKFCCVFGADIAPESFGKYRKNFNFPLIDLKKDVNEHYGQFDILTALDVLEHMDNDVAALKNMNRFLSPNGYLILTVPAYKWLWSGEDVISEHKRRYTKKTLINCCRAAGCEVQFISYFNLSVLPAIAFVIFLYRIFSPEKPQHSNLRPMSTYLNNLIYRITSLEAHWVGNKLICLPAGSSLIFRLKASV